MELDVMIFDVLSSDSWIRIWRSNKEFPGMTVAAPKKRKHIQTVNARTDSLGWDLTVAFRPISTTRLAFLLSTIESPRLEAVRSLNHKYCKKLGHCLFRLDRQVSRFSQNLIAEDKFHTTELHWISLKNRIDGWENEILGSVSQISGENSFWKGRRRKQSLNWLMRYIQPNSSIQCVRVKRFVSFDITEIETNHVVQLRGIRGNEKKLHR